MSRIEDRFRILRERNEGALIVFAVAGHPNPVVSASALRAIADSGADIIELGVPFSDPLADGPVIQAASQSALRQDVTPATVLEMSAALRSISEVPIVLMTCYNPICQFGLDRFAAEAVAAGVDGIIVTDLPPEESDEWVRTAGEHGIDTVFLIAPNSPSARVKKVVDIVGGFVYCVSRMGVTGARAELPANLKKLVARIRKETTKPVAVGFGISEPEHVCEVCRMADGAVVGSALVSLIEREKSSAGFAAKVTEFVGKLKAATRTRDAPQIR